MPQGKKPEIKVKHFNTGSTAVRIFHKQCVNLNCIAFSKYGITIQNGLENMSPEQCWVTGQESEGSAYVWRGHFFIFWESVSVWVKFIGKIVQTNANK